MKAVPADPHVRSMAVIRLVSASLEVTAALLMLRSGRVDEALAINALLGLLGPAFFALVSTIGLLGLAGVVPWPRLALTGVGVLLVVGAARLGR